MDFLGLRCGSCFIERCICVTFYEYILHGDGPTECNMCGEVKDVGETTYTIYLSLIPYNISHKIHSKFHIDCKGKVELVYSVQIVESAQRSYSKICATIVHEIMLTNEATLEGMVHLNACKSTLFFFFTGVASLVCVLGLLEVEEHGYVW